MVRVLRNGCPCAVSVHTVTVSGELAGKIGLFPRNRCSSRPLTRRFSQQPTKAWRREPGTQAPVPKVPELQHDDTDEAVITSTTTTASARPPTDTSTNTVRTTNEPTNTNTQTNELGKTKDPNWPLKTRSPSNETKEELLGVDSILREGDGILASQVEEWVSEGSSGARVCCSAESVSSSCVEAEPHSTAHHHTFTQLHTTPSHITPHHSTTLQHTTTTTHDHAIVLTRQTLSL